MGGNRRWSEKNTHLHSVTKPRDWTQIFANNGISGELGDDYMPLTRGCFHKSSFSKNTIRTHLHDEFDYSYILKGRNK